MTFFEISIISIFAASLLLNFLYVIFNEQMAKYTFRWDLFRWISSYQLFTITPRSIDLLYRDKLPNNKMTAWKKIIITPHRKWYHPFFFPENFTLEVIYSFADDLIRLQKLKKDPKKISKSFIYQTILRYIQQYPMAENSVGRQFKIEETHGFLSDDVQQFFVSEFHNK